MADNVPGGCGNDFALDDITFRECVKTPPIVARPAKNPVIVKKQPTPKHAVTTAPKAPILVKKEPEVPAPKPVVVVKKQLEVPAAKPVLAVKKQPEVPAPKTAVVVKKPITVPKPKEEGEAVKIQPQIGGMVNPPSTASTEIPAVVKPKPVVFPPAPTVLINRTNQLVKLIETAPGDIRLDLYDNGEIDGDTVSVYHNNALLVSHARLSQKPISFRIAIDAAHPHHEVTMVAHNLGSIPPNTSLMVVNAGTRRFEVFISSTEQKNAKVIFDLKE